MIPMTFNDPRLATLNGFKVELNAEKSARISSFIARRST